jgi:hypothetical protein
MISFVVPNEHVPAALSQGFLLKVEVKNGSSWVGRRPLVSIPACGGRWAVSRADNRGVRSVGQSARSPVCRRLTAGRAFLEAGQSWSLSRFGGKATRILRQRRAEQNRLRAREKKVETCRPDVKMGSRRRRGNGRSSSWVAAVASVSAGVDQPGGARRGGKEAAEAACADRDEEASKDQAPEEDLARQVETRHACPTALRGGRVLGGET